jgi:hypothetical protein
MVIEQVDSAALEDAVRRSSFSEASLEGHLDTPPEESPTSSVPRDEPRTEPREAGTGPELFENDYQATMSRSVRWPPISRSSRRLRPTVQPTRIGTILSGRQSKARRTGLSPRARSACCGRA